MVPPPPLQRGGLSPYFTEVLLRRASVVLIDFGQAGFAVGGIRDTLGGVNLRLLSKSLPCLVLLVAMTRIN